MGNYLNSAFSPGLPAYQAEVSPAALATVESFYWHMKGISSKNVPPKASSWVNSIFYDGYL